MAGRGTAPTWLLVFWGAADWPATVAAALARVRNADPEAHVILSAEHDGPRWSLLLVHWTAAERDDLMGQLQPHWAHCFVNHVEDVTPQIPHSREGRRAPQ